MTSYIPHTEIPSLIPHRFENLLIDSATATITDTSYEGVTHLTIPTADPQGRDIFSKQKTPTQRVILATVFMEILALGSIVCSGASSDEVMVFFASISKFVKHGDLRLDSPIEGHIRKKKSKGEFLICEGTIQQDNMVIASGDMMAFFFKKTDAQQDSIKKVSDSVTIQDTIHIPLVKDPALKNPYMYMTDALIHREATTAMGAYTFPTQHPLIRGHFPDRPVLMGVLQWMMIEDTLLALALEWKKEGITGQHHVTLAAELVKKDLTVVCEIKGIEAITYIDCPPYLNQVEIIKTDKVVFRDTVSPGETVYISLTNIHRLS